MNETLKSNKQLKKYNHLKCTCYLLNDWCYYTTSIIDRNECFLLTWILFFFYRNPIFHYRIILNYKILFNIITYNDEFYQIRVKNTKRNRINKHIFSLGKNIHLIILKQSIHITFTYYYTNFQFIFLSGMLDKFLRG